LKVNTKPDQYFDIVEEQLLTEAKITDLFVMDRWHTDINGYFRARLRFTNGDKLEFAEYVQHNAAGTIAIITYAYHWMKSDDQLHARWDNTPHHPTLANSPFHRHQANQVHPDQPRTIHSILKEILNSIP
jgi:hypothetical protein